jgi:hypothetical protein
MGYQNLLRSKQYNEGLALMTIDELPFASTRVLVAFFILVIILAGIK